MRQSYWASLEVCSLLKPVIASRSPQINEAVRHVASRAVRSHLPGQKAVIFREFQ